MWKLAGRKKLSPIASLLSFGRMNKLVKTVVLIRDWSWMTTLVDRKMRKPNIWCSLMCNQTWIEQTRYENIFLKNSILVNDITNFVIIITYIGSNKLLQRKAVYFTKKLRNQVYKFVRRNKWILRTEVLASLVITTRL